MQYKLEDICLKITDGSHYSPSDDFNSDIPMLSVKDMDEFDFNYDNCKHISEEEYDKMLRNDCVPKLYDVLVAKDGSYLKEIFVNEKETKKAILSSIAIFRPNQEIVDSYFLCYLLKTPIILNYVKDNCVSGSALPRIILRAFKEIKLTIPSLEIQKKIVKIVKNINSKIRINNQINDNLLEFGLNGVLNECYQERVRLETLANVISKGTTPTGSDIKKYPNKDIKFIKVKDFNEYGVDEKNIEFISNEIHTGKLKRSMLLEDDLLVSIAGTLGKIAIVTNSLDNANTNQAVAFVRLEKTINKGYLYFYMHTKEFQEDIIKKQVHAVQPNLSLTELGNIMVPVLRDENKNLYNVLLQKLILNVEENKKLEQLRDSLLPKLMNGEIDLDKIEI